MPFARPRRANDPNAKKVTWLELFFDLIFALALAMAAKPLEHVSDLSTDSFLGLGAFILLFVFLIMFWYRHMVLVNRFDHSSFMFSVITMFIGFLVIAFTQFIRIWEIDAALGSFLATITISIATLSVAGLYLISTIRVGGGSEADPAVTWAKAYGKHMLWESLGYMLALFLTPGIRPFWFIGVFIYFHRYPFETWINPKKKSTLNPAVYTLPPEFPHHKVERVGLFSLLVYGLLIVLAATPLLEITKVTSVESVIGPVLSFGLVFLFIGIIWSLHYRLFEISKPKTNQFVAMNFISLGLLVAATHFMRIMLELESNFASIRFAVLTGLLLTVTAIAFWNIKKMATVPPTQTLEKAYRQWAYAIYFSAAIFFASAFFVSPIREYMWKGILLIGLLVMIFDKRLTAYYSVSADAKKVIKFLDYQTSVGIMLIFVGGIAFFVLTALMRKPIASWWMIIWLSPLAGGIFSILNHWLHTRIKPN